MSNYKKDSLDDIIFENRNKDYGAYELRKKDSKYTTIAFLIGSSFFILLIYAIFSANKSDKNKKVEQKIVTVDLTDLNIPEKDEKIYDLVEKEPPKAPQQDEVAQIKVVIPEVKKAPKVEQTVPKVEETKNKVLGLEDKEGKATTDQALANGPKNDVPPAPPQPKPIDENAIFDNVEVEAQYPGGMDALRKFLANNIEYPERAMERGTEGKVLLKFVVEKNGTISDIIAVKDPGDGLAQEAIRVLKKTKKWTPGKKDGQPVRSRYRVPINFAIPK